ncbi:MAG: VacB/RNase II family 3'-5' exoribonuclease [Kiritimatiellaeota bacterium]|nr:VacB/RNase II family 3'-5' exoribonuclease [Kiritimatiellota bacterium]
MSLSKRMSKHSHNKRKSGKGVKRPSKNSCPKTFSGKLTVTAGGFGFLAMEAGDEPDVFIPPQYIAGALDGDTVKVELLEERGRRISRTGRTRGPAAKVVAIQERGRKTVVGELLAGRKVRPLNKKLPDLTVKGSLGDASKGDWVNLELPLPPKTVNAPIPPASLIESLGKAGTVASDLAAVIAEYNLPPPYSESQNEAAAAIRQDDSVNRVDLTSLFCVTIDPEDAKDFDDSVSIRDGEKTGEVELGVHIADVSAWIQPGSEWDALALRRAFTAYIPGNTLPMLSKSLTKLASLTTGADSFAHTVLLTIDSSTGEVLKSKRCFSKIRITARLTFDETQSAIDGDPPAGWSGKLRDKISGIYELTRKMRDYRAKTEQFIELATTEIRVICDDESKEILGISRKKQTEADKLVEECMLAANVEVAKELERRNLPGIFRIHPEPDEEKLLEFSMLMEKTFGLFTGDLSNRSVCNEFLASLPDDHTKPVILDAFLRSLMRASYIEEPALHFGLGKTRYSHFTSPIRRYPDLAVHQQLRAADARREIRGKQKMGNIAKTCSERESIVDQAYYAANDRLKLHYIRQMKLDGSMSLLEGVVRDLSNSGLRVDIPEMGIQGFLPVEYLSGKFKKRGDALVALSGHDKFERGDFIFLQLDRIDMIRGAALFKLAGMQI